MDVHSIIIVAFLAEVPVLPMVFCQKVEGFALFCYSAIFFSCHRKLNLGIFGLIVQIFV